MDVSSPSFSYLIAVNDRNAKTVCHYPALDDLVKDTCRERGIVLIWSMTTASHYHDSLPIVADAGATMGTE